MAVAIVVLGLYVATSGILTPARPTGAPATSGVSVSFAPAILGTTTCGGSTSYPTEQLRIQSLSRPFTTAQVVVEVLELGDGDPLPSVPQRPQATLASLCGGSAAPTSGPDWYAVLVGAGGQNLATYTYSQSWAPVPGASFPSMITNQSSFAFVLGQNLSGQGYGAIVNGLSPGVPIYGEGTF